MRWAKGRWPGPFFLALSLRADGGGGGLCVWLLLLPPLLLALVLSFFLLVNLFGYFLSYLLTYL